MYGYLIKQIFIWIYYESIWVITANTGIYNHGNIATTTCYSRAWGVWSHCWNTMWSSLSHIEVIIDYIITDSSKPPASTWLALEYHTPTPKLFVMYNNYFKHTKNFLSSEVETNLRPYSKQTMTTIIKY